MNTRPTRKHPFVSKCVYVSTEKCQKSHKLLVKWKFPVVHKHFFAETGPAMMHRHGVILHAVQKRGCGVRLILLFSTSCFQPTAHSPFHRKASCKNDVTTACHCWTSFQKNMLTTFPVSFII